MKILYISHTSEMHGSGKAILNIIEQMIQKDTDVYVILPKAEGTLYNNIKKLKIKYSIEPVAFWIWPRLINTRDYILFIYRIFKLIIKSLLFYIQLIRIVKEYKPNIIHTNVGVVHIGQMVANKMKISHVWHIREYQDLDFGWKTFPSKKQFQKKLLHSNNYPIFITKGVYDHYHLNLNNNAKVIYDGVFDATTIPHIKIQKKRYFLFVGLISVGKGTLEAINAFLSISPKYPEYELWIAGSGNELYIKKLKMDFATSKSSKQIKFLGHRTDVYRLMSDATALIVASKFEGFGFITAEAMFNGCLVIGRNTAGTKEQFDNGLNLTGEEIGIRYNSIEELKSSMQKLCETGIDCYLDKLKKAQQTVIELYSSQKNAEEIYSLYKEILKKY